ncbi:diadenylate cyclase CdaA [Weissella cibaria]|jgi:diadenylate cyclase|uniref:Diadenylate cyclase n=1 Tax=Weissella cibaria TaxID=137591 RepID=A0A0D1KJ60_9LACO|nr:diadenylate cyclase CdaA [Weissella cibaria]AWF95053.1 Diadenylate cyclase [Weissella cibaria]KIU24744.1 DNA integrity scanning protein DisA [Weissella cibaria]MBU7560900.1 diadenylate cyclase CdaA [Weissella cibaria]MBZ5942310.1 diadenylate cyclase CdaA [Weissella cibaria]MYV35819.1 TIGR00159 family protein [Weissella cibaria]
MNFNIEALMKSVSIVRIIDVVIVWWLLYRLMMLIRGTKAVTLLRGVGIVIVVKVVSWYIGLTTISWLTDQIINWGVIALVVVFQPEIRRGLEHLGRSALFKQRQAYQDETKLINELDDAIQYMSKRHIGALISIEMETGLEEYIETGIKIDAEVTSQLLINTFIPNTPLHDGAVIIKDARLAAAAAYLPLSDNPTIPKELGTRHRASVGISEVTDALTIVVSEETGAVSITRNAELMQSLSREDYRKYLTRQLVPENGAVKQNWWSRFVPTFKRGEK